MSVTPSLEALRAAAARGDHEAVIRLATALLADQPGTDIAHELRARAEMALGRLAEAEADAQAAVRLDPDEVRYRELLAEVLAAAGAHREAADEYARLARLDPRQSAWIRGEAAERLAGAESDEAVAAARQALRLDPGDAVAQATLARGLLRAGQATPALQAAERAVALAPDDGGALETLADALWLAGDEAAALEAYGALARGADPSLASRGVDKARALYRSRAGLGGRLLAGVRPLFWIALRAGRVRLRAGAAGEAGFGPPPTPRG
jgi:tetratricopeptide (TPR) repeat protein